jgi:putative phage-type endonuclease
VFGNADYTIDLVKARLVKVGDYVAQLERLAALPKIDQRTPIWYETRQGLITASDFAQALGDGKFGTKEQLMKKKCGYEEEKFNASSPPLKWGTMFEPVASDIYETRNKMKLHEFGLLKHPSIDYFGASPDGVNECGVMVEIKCPYRRKIDGQVPLQYYYQIQGQLDVCGLDECDFFECEFFSSEYAEDLLTCDAKGEMGVIIEYPDFVYTYSPASYGWTTDDLTEWTDVAIEKLKGECKSNHNIKVQYYRLEKCSTVRVYKDPTFLELKLADLSEVWKKIKEYRADEDMYNRELRKASTASSTKTGGASAFSASATKLTGWAFN